MKADPNDRGDTLIELLVTVVIVGVAVVALVGGIATSIRMSDIHRKQAAAGAYVRAFAEAIEAYVTASPSGYTPCAGKATYAPAYTALNGNPTYSAKITDVTYWDGSSAFGKPVPCNDTGVQKVSLTVTADDTVTETLDVIIRKPCRSTTDFPLDAPCT
jgi:prepilin-type N-terminal cleavage/methylation domain-containing protein